MFSIGIFLFILSHLPKTLPVSLKHEGFSKPASKSIYFPAMPPNLEGFSLLLSASNANNVKLPSPNKILNNPFKVPIKRELSSSSRRQRFRNSFSPREDFGSRSIFGDNNVIQIGASEVASAPKTTYTGKKAALLAANPALLHYIPTNGLSNFLDATSMEDEKNFNDFMSFNTYTDKNHAIKPQENPDSSVFIQMSSDFTLPPGFSSALEDGDIANYSPGKSFASQNKVQTSRSKSKFSSSRKNNPLSSSRSKVPKLRNKSKRPKPIEKPKTSQSYFSPVVPESFKETKKAPKGNRNNHFNLDIPLKNYFDSQISKSVLKSTEDNLYEEKFSNTFSSKKIPSNDLDSDIIEIYRPESSSEEVHEFQRDYGNDFNSPSGSVAFKAYSHSEDDFKEDAPVYRTSTVAYRAPSSLYQDDQPSYAAPTDSQEPDYVRTDPNIYVPTEYDTSAIPGEAGLDYPVYHRVPDTNFKCENQEYPGLYADEEAGCQVFHICQDLGREDSFLCPNGTIFNQRYFVCDWWYNFFCEEARSYYDLNALIYELPNDGKGYS